MDGCSTRPPTTSPAQELAIVARELAVIGDRIADAVTNARGLSAATDWQAKAATAYHEKADAWAGAVSSLLKPRRDGAPRRRTSPRPSRAAGGRTGPSALRTDGAAMSSDGPGLDDGRPKVDLDPDWSLIDRLPEVWPRTDSGLEIRGGGTVSIDTETLRRNAGRFVQAKIDLDSIGERPGSLTTRWGGSATAPGRRRRARRRSGRTCSRCDVRRSGSRSRCGGGGRVRAGRARRRAPRGNFRGRRREDGRPRRADGTLTAQVRGLSHLPGGLRCGCRSELPDCVETATEHGRAGDVAGIQIDKPEAPARLVMDELAGTDKRSDVLRRDGVCSDRALFFFCARSNPMTERCTAAAPVASLVQANVRCANLTRHPAAKTGPNSAGTGSPCAIEFVDTKANSP